MLIILTFTLFDPNIAVGTDESLFLLATCYFRNGQLHQAYDILRKHESKLPKNRFLLAKCCMKLEK